ncbi:unnamed protein product [Rangifer tarandus platyrhynchus]|uniref:Uncharacterized protein n=1 Tax=Rangifer tarandus platyrhynchus TaxID=3082113 RepID=A0AC59YCC7_RANTA
MRGLRSLESLGLKSFLTQGSAPATPGHLWTSLVHRARPPPWASFEAEILLGGFCAISSPHCCKDARVQYAHQGRPPYEGDCFACFCPTLTPISDLQALAGLERDSYAHHIRS